MVKYIILSITAILLFSCQNNTKKVNEKTGETIVENKRDYKKEGKEIAENTFKVLSANLKAAMQKGGVKNAVNFCNIKAMPLTDSLSQVYNAEIKRVSHKPRNSHNSANKAEQKILDEYLAQTPEQWKPTVVENEKGVHTFYAPIPTKGLCLTCHGVVSETLLEENYQTIVELYPNDEAVGFKEGDLRGIWSIKFKE